MPELVTPISKLDEKTLQRIRNRGSYKEFQELYKFASTSPSPEQVLNKVYKMLDQNRAFGSFQQAGYAFESLKLVVRDARTCKFEHKAPECRKR